MRGKSQGHGPAEGLKQLAVACNRQLSHAMEANSLHWPARSKARLTFTDELVLQIRSPSPLLIRPVIVEEPDERPNIFFNHRNIRWLFRFVRWKVF